MRATPGKDEYLRLLLTETSWRQPGVESLLPRLLNPLGIKSLHAGDALEAQKLLDDKEVHVAIVDLDLPLNKGASSKAGGDRILQLLRRLKTPPPTVVVRRHPGARRADGRELANLLKEGAFAVLDRPVDLEMMLEVLRRVLRRYYKDAWPCSGSLPNINEKGNPQGIRENQ